MKICPYCETENDDNALTCIQCEYEFEVISETVNNTSESISSDFSEKSVQSENEYRKPPHKSNSKTGIIALVSVLLVCGVAGGVYYSKNKAKIKAKTAIVTAKTSNKKSNKDVQKKETPAQSETDKNENSDSTVPLTDESSIPETIEDMYTADEITAMYLEYIEYLADEENYFSSISSECYGLVDLNNDETPEVLIAEKNDGEYTSKFSGAFTINEGHFRMIINSGPVLNTLYDNDYVGIGYKGMAGMIWGNCIERYISGYYDYTYSRKYPEFEFIDDISDDISTGLNYHNDTVISESEAEAIMAQYPEKQFKTKSFTNVY